MKVFRLYFVFIVFCCACEKSSEVPVALIPVFEYLDNNMSEADISELQLKEDKGYPPYYHELTIQDELQSLLRENKTKWAKVNSYFNAHDINDLTDKYGVIINMYQNYLNHIDIEITDEIEIIESYYTPILSCNSVLQEQAENYFNLFQVNDTISVQMPVDEHENAVDYVCPNIDWTFIEGHDLKLQVVIREKLNKGNIDLNAFKAEVLYMSNDFTSILSKEIIEGEHIIIHAKTAWKLKPNS